jgi:predicted negative regulator of RcsB-dependent stress response
MAGRTDAMKQPVTPKVAPPAAPIIAEGLSREEKLAAWVQKNGKFLAIAGGVVALVMLVTWFMSASAKRKENYARQALEQAWGAADAGNIPQASADLQKVATNFAGTDAAFEAVLSLNQTRLLAGQAQLAVDDLKRFIETRPPAQFAAPANMLLGGALENLGKPTEAIPAYEAANAVATLDHVKAEALLGVARAARSAGQKDKALSALREVVEKYKETAAFPVAEVRLGEIAASN